MLGGLGVLVAAGGAVLTLAGNPEGPGSVAALGIGAPVLAAGVALSVVHLVLASRSSRRSEFADG